MNEFSEQGLNLIEIAALVVVVGLLVSAVA
jgi:hypothetical protein